MDVELSKEATVATESFNDCCMSCSLGILAAKSPISGSNQQQQQQPQNRCKLISPLASSLSGQLYEQTYSECCLENIPKVSGALIEPGKFHQSKDNIRACNNEGELTLNVSMIRCPN